MSEFADAYIKRLKDIKEQPNTFFFDGDALVLVPKDRENMNKLKEFEAARKEGIEKNLREQIAKEIESTWFYDFQCKYSNCKSFQQAAAIARGEVKE